MVRRSAPHVVVVGGGFGGLYAATYLARSEIVDRGGRITLVDRKNYFVFTPLLAEVVAGTLGRQHVTYPHRVVARRYGFAFVQDVAREIDLDRGVLRTSLTEIPFDYLVLAVGSEPHWFGDVALRPASLPLTTVDEALAIRDRVIGSLERVALDDVGNTCRTTFVVAGAGPAGVEVASEIHTLANHVLRPYYPGTPGVHVILVDPADGILPGWDADLAEEGLRCLRARGIDVRLGTRIEAFADGCVTTRMEDRSERIPACALIWTAGTTPAAWVSGLPLPTERGAVRVRPTLQVEGHERLFAVGDVTSLVDARTGGPYPRVAPIAISQGMRAAANIENLVLGRPLEPYRAHHAGKIVSLGSGVALVDLLGVRITGPPAWWIYRATYLIKLVGTKNKLRVLFTLALNRFFEPDIGSELAPAEA